MVEQKTYADTHQPIRGRPHERTLERLTFEPWIGEMISADSLDPTSRIWFQRRFLDELDRRRGLERVWRRAFWFNRYIILSGSLVLPVLITAGKSVTWLNIISIVVSIVVALASAMEALLRSGRRWRLYKQGADKISSEGAAFFQMLGVYADTEPSERLHIFKDRVEHLIIELHDSYVADIDIMSSQNTIGSASDRTA